MNDSPLARDLMSRPVRQLKAWTSVRQAAAFLLRHRISGAPVLGEHGDWEGVFTLSDLARTVQSRILPPPRGRILEDRGPVPNPFGLPPEELAKTPVREFMTAGLVSVFPEATLEEIIHTLLSFKVHRVFVIEGRKGAIVGVITTMDILRHLERRSLKPSGKRKRTRQG